MILSTSYHSDITILYYERRTESHEQLFFCVLFFACELGTVDEGEHGGRWNQLLLFMSVL